MNQGRSYGSALFPAMVLAILPVLPSFAFADSAKAVASLDLNRFTGAWYEVARLPNRRERICVSDNLVLYALGDKRNTFQVVTSCEIKAGGSEAWNDKGKASANADGRLKLSRLLLLSSKYWVLATDADYSWAVVGSPNHRSLWLLTRSTTPDARTVASIQAKAAGMGFDTAKLIQASQKR